MGVSPLNLKTLGNVSFIVLGVIIASYGEIKFVMTGFVFQLAGVAFEATRLVMVQKLLSSAEFKMDPLVSLYYFAPACAVMNGIVSLIIEVPGMTWADIQKVGYIIFVLNALVAFALNVSVVFLVSLLPIPIISLHSANKIPTDRQNLRPRHDSLRCTQGHSSRRRLHDDLPRPRFSPPVLRIQHCARWSRLLQAWSRQDQGAHGFRTACLGRLRRPPSCFPQAHRYRPCSRHHHSPPWQRRFRWSDPRKVHHIRQREARWSHWCLQGLSSCGLSTQRGRFDIIRWLHRITRRFQFWKWRCRYWRDHEDLTCSSCEGSSMSRLEQEQSHSIKRAAAAPCDARIDGDSLSRPQKTRYTILGGRRGKDFIGVFLFFFPFCHNRGWNLGDDHMYV